RGEPLLLPLEQRRSEIRRLLCRRRCPLAFADHHQSIRPRRNRAGTLQSVCDTRRHGARRHGGADHARGGLAFRWWLALHAQAAVLRDLRRGRDAGHAGLAIVCDTADSAAAVGANLERAGLVAVSVLHSDSMTSLDGRAATALHDASPRGCALVLELHDAGADVVDAGLRPAWVDTP